jgi:hypothetical protein
MKSILVVLVLAILAITIGLFVAPQPAACNQGNCPTLASGACDPAIIDCGTIKRIGRCETHTKQNGALACRCVPR